MSPRVNSRSRTWSSRRLSEVNLMVVPSGSARKALPDDLSPDRNPGGEHPCHHCVHGYHLLVLRAAAGKVAVVAYTRRSISVVAPSPEDTEPLVRKPRLIIDGLQQTSGAPGARVRRVATEVVCARPCPSTAHPPWDSPSLTTGPVVEPVRDAQHRQSMSTQVQQTLGDGSALDRLTFLVPNGWNVWHGGNICDAEEPDPYWPGRIVAQAKGWWITIDRRRDAHEAHWRNLRDTGQSGVTHIGQLKRQDGSTFTTEDSAPVLRALRLAFSLAVGRAVGPLLPVGWRQEAPVWTQWRRERIDSVRPSGQFLDRYAGHTQVAELIERVVDFCDIDDRMEVLQYAVSYYITATYDADDELRVALPVSGMQLLAYRRFVEERQSFTNNQWADLGKADSLGRGQTECEIRRLLDDCNIATGLPSQFANLQKVSAALPALKDGSPRDALGCVISMRNKIIHPTKALPSTWDAYQWWEAASYAVDAFLLSILNTIGYTGQYRSAVATNVSTGVTNPVPWVPPLP